MERGLVARPVFPAAILSRAPEPKDRDLGMVTEDGNPIIAKGNYTIRIGGGQPDTGAPTINGKFHIDDQVDLPE